MGERNPFDCIDISRGTLITHSTTTHTPIVGSLFKERGPFYIMNPISAVSYEEWRMSIDQDAVCRAQIEGNDHGMDEHTRVCPIIKNENNTTTEKVWGFCRFHEGSSISSRNHDM